MTHDSNSSTQTIENHQSNEAAVSVQKKIEVLLLGYLDNPRIKCMKQLYNKSANSELVSLAVKKDEEIQKFKLPFKNLSSYLDSDIEFAFIRTTQQTDSQKIEPIDCLSFYCKPNQLKIAAD
jgi:hypothetical protein